MKSLLAYLLSIVIIIGIVFGGLTILKKEFPKQYNDLMGYVQDFKDYFKEDEKNLNTSSSSSSNSSSNSSSSTINNPSTYPNIISSGNGTDNSFITGY